MKWSEICEDEQLRNLPYKIELNEWGNIVMSPASNRHGNIQTKIAFYLMNWAPNGTVLTECSVATDKGVKVAAVAWVSDEFLNRNRGRTPYPEASEICVEIKSPSNTEEEMLAKKALYFAKGAKEYWLCDENGNLTFYNAGGKIDGSDYVPAMVAQISVDA